MKWVCSLHDRRFSELKSVYHDGQELLMSLVLIISQMSIFLTNVLASLILNQYLFDRNQNKM